MVSCSSASRSAFARSAAAETLDTSRSKILLRLVGGSNDDDLEARKSSQSGLVLYCCRLKEMVGAHLSKNCKVSKLTLRVMASGFSATASTTGFSALFMSPAVSDSGSFSQSTRSEGASGVEIVAGSLRYCLSDSLMSNSIRSSMIDIYTVQERKERIMVFTCGVVVCARESRSRRWDRVV
jgi:hypothetical protein